MTDGFAPIVEVLDEGCRLYGYLNYQVLDPGIKNGTIPAADVPGKKGKNRILVDRAAALEYLRLRNERLVAKAQEKAEREQRIAKREQEKLARRAQKLRKIADDPQGYRDRVEEQLTKAQRAADNAEALIREALSVVETAKANTSTEVF